jgi:hypothetical protein
MLETFMLPFSMAAGGVLVASPIIIHLINRMRFKRIRWAAMEFLLKSQKRNRRRLIIEQLILLLLRIILVVLAALILARFIGFAFALTPQNRQHVVILDDTLSMGDQWLEDGETRTSFKSAKKLIHDEIAKNALLASKTQQMKLILASRPEEVVFDQRLSDSTKRDLETLLATMDKETALHVDLLQSVKKARKLFGDTPQDQRILYIVSDFRSNDWSEPKSKELFDELKALADLGVYVKFVDVAHPARKDSEAEQRYHDNLAIVHLVPEARVVAQDTGAELKVVVANYSPSDAKNIHVRIRLNGQDRLGSDVPIDVIPAGAQVEKTVPALYFDQPGPNLVSAHIDPTETGLNIDNVRYAVIDVRKRVPILMIDGDNTARTGSDRFYMEKMFGTENRPGLPGFQVEAGSPSRLEEADLERYPSIFLFNVPRLTDKALQNLDGYVREGGSVAFFLGDRVDPEFYNKKLFADGQGLFPAPLADRFTAELTEEEKREREEGRRGADLPPRYLEPRDLTHPVFKDMLGADQKLHPLFEVLFRFELNIDRHFPIARTRWSPRPGRDQEIASLPNTKSSDDFKDGIQKLLERLPIDDPKFKPYAGRLKEHRDTIRNLLAGKEPLYKVAAELERTLQDAGDPNKPDKANLIEFWTMPEVASLKTDFERMHDAVKYGDALLIESRYGKGRVVVCTTALTSRWSNMGGIFEFAVIFLGALEKHLIGVQKDADLLVGTPLDISLDQTRYDTKMRRFRWRETDAAQKGNAAKSNNLIDLGEQQQVGSPVNGRIHFRFADAMEPGMYVLEFYPAAGLSGGKPEQRSFAFNVDTAAESNLLRYRITREDLERTVPNSRLYSLGADRFSDLAEQKADLSKKPWLYLAFLVVLLIEQALAVHLSFHLRGGPAPGAVARPETATV